MLLGEALKLFAFPFRGNARDTYRHLLGENEILDGTVTTVVYHGAWYTQVFFPAHAKFMIRAARA